MPRLGETMEEGRIVRWLKAAGQAFERGEAILEVETDKTVAEFPALRSGTLVEILRGEDETVSVGEAIARIQVEGDREASPEDEAAGRLRGMKTVRGRSRRRNARPHRPRPPLEAGSAAQLP